ncbi:type II toxin-antitoxin system Phd/YefM family antitoxin [Glycomyces xiaoerkulensis]|uniref:type II toxin-antitoxin system Phd/YefM family antitoxin n=1 Tax=Glycomyces xiaoerkulensis TaxID=2038139 RepID=UPI000C261EF4|nr:type II toxin-antitoxin system prevent-host-death family antitoxin [Glycomyces xiaoerkulensis]
MDTRPPREIGIRDLSLHTSEYLAWVSKGHELVVTNRGRPAARLVPITDPGEDRIDALIRSGALIAPKEPGDPLDVLTVVSSESAPTSEQVLDDIREDRL